MSSTNDTDLTSVTQRTKRVLKLRGVEPFYGMPEVIEESYIDLATGKEKLLSKQPLPTRPVAKYPARTSTMP